MGLRATLGHGSGLLINMRVSVTIPRIRSCAHSPVRYAFISRELAQRCGLLINRKLYSTKPLSRWPSICVFFFRFVSGQTNIIVESHTVVIDVVGIVVVICLLLIRSRSSGNLEHKCVCAVCVGMCVGLIYAQRGFFTSVCVCVWVWDIITSTRAPIFVGGQSANVTNVSRPLILFHLYFA